MFTTYVGTAYGSHNLRRDSAGSPRRPDSALAGCRENCGTPFVSMMSYQGVPVEEIARLAGHASSRTTGVIYQRDCGR